MHAWVVLWLVRLTPWAKRLSTVGAVGALVYGSFYLKLGELTLAQHLQRIWQTDEVVDLRQGVAAELEDAKGAALDEIKTRMAATRTSD